MKRLVSYFGALFLYVMLLSFVFIRSSQGEGTQHSWQFKSVKRETINNAISYEVEYNIIGYKSSGIEDMTESEFYLLMKHFGVNEPQELVGKVFTTDVASMWLDKIIGRESAREERDKALQKEWQDRYQKAGFSDSAPILNCDFSSPVIGGGMLGTGRASVFEKAIWNGDELEVNILMSVNCAARDIKGIARLNGDRVELTAEPHFPPDGSMALCESVHRYIFKIRNLEKKDYKIGFRSGLFTEEVSLKSDTPIITEPLEFTMAREAEKAKEKNRQEIEMNISKYTKEIEANPKSDSSYYWRGLAYRRKGNLEQGISDFSKALEVNPASLYATNIYRFRAEIYCDLLDYDKAWNDWHKAQSMGYYGSEFVEKLKKASGREN